MDLGRLPSSLIGIASYLPNHLIAKSGTNAGIDSKTHIQHRHISCCHVMLDNYDNKPEVRYAETLDRRSFVEHNSNLQHTRLTNTRETRKKVTQV